MPHYDLGKLQQLKVPLESVRDWIDIVTHPDPTEARNKMGEFILNWGNEVFWAYKDQQHEMRGQQPLSDKGKELYVNKLLSSYKSRDR